MCQQISYQKCWSGGKPHGSVCTYSFKKGLFSKFLNFVQFCFFSIFLVLGNISFANAAAMFSVETTNLSAGDTFTFTLAAAGAFDVDCGSGGVLTSSANDVTGPVNNVYTITRANTTSTTYTCTYANSGGVKTIGFSGTATGYLRDEDTATIKFTSPALVAALSGDLSEMFPSLGVNAGPVFFTTFQDCTELTELPDTLFAMCQKVW